MKVGNCSNYLIMIGAFRKKKKEYVPKARSGAYAVLLALYKVKLCVLRSVWSNMYVGMSVNIYYGTF